MDQCRKCYSENVRTIATSGHSFTKQCKDCGNTWGEAKQKQSPKKSLLKKILRR